MNICINGPPGVQQEGTNIIYPKNSIYPVMKITLLMVLYFKPFVNLCLYIFFVFDVDIVVKYK